MFILFIFGCKSIHNNTINLNLQFQVGFTVGSVSSSAVSAESLSIPQKPVSSSSSSVSTAVSSLLQSRSDTSKPLSKKSRSDAGIEKKSLLSEETEGSSNQIRKDVMTKQMEIFRLQEELLGIQIKYYKAKLAKLQE